MRPAAVQFGQNGIYETGEELSSFAHALAASEYLERERVVGGSRGGRRRSGDASRRRREGLAVGGDLRRKRGRVSARGKYYASRRCLLREELSRGSMEKKWRRWRRLLPDLEKKPDAQLLGG